MQRREMKLGEVLCQKGCLTEAQLAVALADQQITGDKLGRILVRLGFISELILMETLEIMLGVPYIRLDRYRIETTAVQLVPSSLAQKHKVLPLTRRENKLILAMADPLDYMAIEDIGLATSLEVVPVLVGEQELDRAIRKYSTVFFDSQLGAIIREFEGRSEYRAAGNSEATGPEPGNGAPVVRMVDSLFDQAVLAGASDIHIEPQEDRVRVRLRIDGELKDILSLPSDAGPAVASRIKIMSGIDIAEKRLPQDGRTRAVINGRVINFRVSTFPTIYGEKLVLRLLDRTESFISLDKLGLQSPNRERFIELLRAPEGIVLMTGPTGSGKTSSLYAMIEHLNTGERNIVTLEDPVEFALPGVIQAEINTRTGLTFASGLRAVLRQDPDVIMVGEIRDTETARLVVQAALTGHLVLSTLHTSTALGTVVRLLDMGIEPFLLAPVLVGVVAQRLVRLICPDCREAYQLKGETAEYLGLPAEAGQSFFRGRGCSLCLESGYRGRIALHEVLQVDRKLRMLMAREAAEEELAANLRGQGFVSLRDDGLNKARQGLTSLEEVIKALRLSELQEITEIKEPGANRRQIVRGLSWLPQHMSSK